MSVLITRPKQQAQMLADYLAKHAMTSICLPVLEIVAPQNLAALQDAIKMIARTNILIFVSPATVHALFAAYPQLVLQQPTLLAIGVGTAHALAEYTNQVVIYPGQQNSHSMLALPALQSVIGKRIIIFAGENGNTLLADTLAERGANVHMAYTHRRSLPQYDALEWDPASVTISLCTSGQSLTHFRTIIDQLNLSLLLEKPLLVITTAMEQQARQLGFKSAIIQADGASDAQLLAALRVFQ